MTPTPCPVLALATELRAVIAAVHVVDERRGKSKNGSEKAHLVAADYALNDRRRLLEAQIAQTQATSLQGAMLQIALANGAGDEILGQVQGACRDPAEEAGHRLEGLLYSILAVLERLAGVQLDDEFSSFWMLPEANPHRLVAEALAEGARS